MKNDIVKRLNDFPIRAEAAVFRDAGAVEALGLNESDIDVLPIGESREGRRLVGFRFGDGPRDVSITAGCHAD